MGSRARPAAALVLQAAAFIAALALFAALLPQPGTAAIKLLLGIAAAALAAAIWRRLGHGHREIARFLAALEHGDLAQSFRSHAGGPGLDELGAALDRALARLRRERYEAAGEQRFVGALVDEAPTPLLAIDGAGAVHLANKAARRLFREADGRAVDGFARYGRGFADALAAIAPGDRQVCRVQWNGLSHRAVMQAVAMERQGDVWRIVSLDLIQGELEAAEVAMQTDLVRVLTHEIMNSLTPIASLADSASHLLAEAADGDASAAAEARQAVDALARRAAGIARFVDSYRDFSQSPALAIARFAVQPWLDGLVRTFRATPQAHGVVFDVSLDPPGLRIDGDAALLAQVLLNLLKNAAEAAVAGDAPRVALAIARSDAGRTIITVADNGAGVPAGLEDEIFLPFFTTKRGGTGVGLSFARQVVTLHGGGIGVHRSDGGGAVFTILL